MTETQDWNSGQGAYPRDYANYELLLVNETTDERIVRHLSALPTLDEIRCTAGRYTGAIHSACWLCAKRVKGRAD